MYELTTMMKDKKRVVLSDTYSLFLRGFDNFEKHLEEGNKNDVKKDVKNDVKNEK